VDGRAVPLPLFRAHLSTDRPGACALVGLSQWILPTVASLTRDRALLRRACTDAELCRLAADLRYSDAHWLDKLLGVELDTRWLVLCPLAGRGFRILVDGVTSNFDLHTTVSDALIRRGIPGTLPPARLIAYLAGRAPTPGQDHVEGVWNFYSWRGAAYDLSAPTDVPHDVWVWNEGAPRDVPRFDGIPTLVVGPPPFQRTWNSGRLFTALPVQVTVETELDNRDVQSTLLRMRQSL
jgi:hypothetical protein